MSKPSPEPFAHEQFEPALLSDKPLEPAELADKQFESEHFDIVISGGGMAGSTLAWALLHAQPRLKLAIIEQQAEQVSPVSFDSRSIALAAGSVNKLQQWGLWPELAANACAIKHIHVSDRGHFGKTQLTAAEYQQHALGYVLEVDYLGALLSQKLANCKQLKRFAPNTISQITPTEQHQQLTLNSGVIIKTSLLLIAEGGASPSRTLAGFSVTERHYQQHAVITNLALNHSHQHRAFERFTEHGPIALLPLSKQRFSLVFTTTAEMASSLMQLDDDAFLHSVQQAFGYRAGIFKASGARASYPLSLRVSGDIVRHRVALLGNSLHNLHPIAGQGFNLALRDIAELVRQVTAKPDDIGGYTMLRAYQQARQHDIERVTTATDALVRLFSNRSRTVALARNVGLLAMTLCDELKRPLAEQAMGLRS
ncbi:2-octaprenyl-6-methoxyphenyl hydroxylase [Rheinheimera sp. D18]|uniref:2-octaprenyl-6-methoxyphenyl hydroxylase n=1 Tax=Rheinheimera sp. D18 TaxID=2545632 RepID=UPI0010489D70|nr:2-octaprenyl-6-methoxyphenyl hydroxylase [Rheinheimera sp. D18]QBL09767.1 2-octaprenyl-6-methoxyphenyl hydroxylase [Rheinheimera sp. D18]